MNPSGDFLSNPVLGDGPYRKPTISSDDGTVYVTAGASSSLRAWNGGSNALVNPTPHPVHLVNLRLLGSVYNIEVNRYTMDVSYIGTNSSIRDNFTISKGSYLKTQTEVDNFSSTHGTGTVNGNLTILDDDDGSDPIVDLDGLSALSYVGGETSSLKTTAPLPVFADCIHFTIQAVLMETFSYPGI